MARNLSDRVSEIVTNNPEIYAQYEEASKQTRILLRMVNEKLKEENDACDTYTLTVAADHLLQLSKTRRQ